jgi:hypothetical protein
VLIQGKRRRINKKEQVQEIVPKEKDLEKKVAAGKKQTFKVEKLVENIPFSNCNLEVLYKLTNYLNA